MYLPQEIQNARILITVKTYPHPSKSYNELVCTAGILENGKWVRIYPIDFRDRPFVEQYKKYDFIELDLVKNTTDFRPESYQPKLRMDEKIKIADSIDTSNRWQKRKDFVLQEVFTSMTDLTNLAKDTHLQKSLAVLKPMEIVDLEIIKEDERDWNPALRAQLQQMSIFGKKREIVQKLPYKYSYGFLTEDGKQRKLRILDWEIGALYWNCLARAKGDECEANQKVRDKYLHEFVSKKDIYLILGTTKRWHNVSPNPFIIIGVFYPPKVEAEQAPLFNSQ